MPHITPRATTAGGRHEGRACTGARSRFGGFSPLLMNVSNRQWMVEAGGPDHARPAVAEPPEVMHDERVDIVSPRGDRRLAVRPTDRGEPQRIVVGPDDTTDGPRRPALGREARLTGATVRAVHGRDQSIGIEAFGSVEVGEDGRLPEEKVSGPYRRGIRRVFEEASPESGWQLQFAEGDAGAVLVAEAANADLLVIGTRTN